jgi:hypothetical protein
VNVCRLLEEARITNAAHRHRILYKSEELRLARQLQEQHASGHWSLVALLLTAATACVVAMSASAAAVLCFVPGAATHAAVVVTAIASEVRWSSICGTYESVPSQCKL